jgi:membrane-associated protease RseP (regulator of RpoE activity)
VNRLVLAAALLCGATAFAQPKERPAGLGFEFDRSRPDIKVTAIGPETVAADMGLQVGDIIIGMDGKPVKSLADMGGVLRSRQWWAGDVLKFRVRRGDEELDLAAPMRPAAPSAEGKPATPWKVEKWGNLPEGKEAPTLESLKGKVVVLFCFTST